MAANGEERRNNQNSWAWPSIFLTHDFRKAQMTHLLDLALKPSEHRAGRLAALDEAKINAYASAKELHQDACDLLWEQYGKPLMKYAPKGHEEWWRRQVEVMIEAAMRSAWLLPPRRDDCWKWWHEKPRPYHVDGLHSEKGDET